MKILANDGISASGVDALEAAGFEVILEKVAQDDLIDFIMARILDHLDIEHNVGKRWTGDEI